MNIHMTHLSMSDLIGLWDGSAGTARTTLARALGLRIATLEEISYQLARHTVSRETAAESIQRMIRGDGSGA